MVTVSPSMASSGSYPLWYELAVAVMSASGTSCSNGGRISKSSGSAMVASAVPACRYDALPVNRTVPKGVSSGTVTSHDAANDVPGSTCFAVTGPTASAVQPSGTVSASAAARNAVSLSLDSVVVNRTVWPPTADDTSLVVVTLACRSRAAVCDAAAWTSCSCPARAVATCWGNAPSASCRSIQRCPSLLNFSTLSAPSVNVSLAGSAGQAARRFSVIRPDRSARYVRCSSVSSAALSSITVSKRPRWRYATPSGSTSGVENLTQSRLNSDSAPGVSVKTRNNSWLPPGSLTSTVWVRNRCPSPPDSTSTVARTGPSTEPVRTSMVPPVSPAATRKRSSVTPARLTGSNDT